MGPEANYIRALYLALTNLSDNLFSTLFIYEYMLCITSCIKTVSWWVLLLYRGYL